MAIENVQAVASRAWRPNRPYGEKEWTYCDKCGFQLRMLDARRDWTGGLVHAECVDERPITKRVRTQRSHVQLGWRHRT